MKKVLVIFGTRPEAIKLAPVIRKLKKNNTIQTIIVVTAQHREMLDPFLDFFSIKVNYDLNIMTRNQSLERLTTYLPKKLAILYEKIQPDFILVQGDTTSAFLASLIAFYKRIPLGHVEAGLRTFDKFHPFPEEMNRKFITYLADYHFAPTVTSSENLLREGVDKKRIFITGNTVVDALKFILANKSTYVPKVNVPIKKKQIILITAHRRESFGKPFINICQAIKTLARTYTNIAFVYPVHLNPHVQKPVYSILSGEKNVYLIPPLPYFDLIFLMEQTYLILTDSGGIQEEAPTLKKPLLVLRNVTERPEGIIAGVARLVGTDKKKIIGETEKLLNDQSEYQRMVSHRNPYGDGKASIRIVSAIQRILFKK